MTKQELEIQNQSLKNMLKQIFWMARRYAHGRHTYAPGMVREAYEYLKLIGVDIPKDKTIEPPKEEIKGMTFRSDYLDDTNI